MTIDDYLLRQRVVDNLLMRGLWDSNNVRRLVYSVLGTEAECDKFLMNASSEDIDRVLVSQGFDLDELKQKIEQSIASFRAISR